MAQMESILATNASARKEGESDLDYINNYIDHNLFTQINFKGGSRKKHRNRTAHRKRKRSQRKRA